MVIVFVVDTFCEVLNGTTMTAQRFVKGLRERGHEVRVLAIGEPGPDNYYVNEAHYGFISKLGHASGIGFAKFDRAVARQALDGADVVHFLLPLPFEMQVLKVAQEMGVPHSAAYHMQPENMSYIMHMNKVPGFNTFLYNLYNKVFFKHFRHIHCPSQFIARELQKHQYEAKLYVISNGVGENFVPAETYREPDPDLYHILMIGRLNPEKRQEVLIDAVAHSKYKDKIQIHFAGIGNTKKHLIEKGRILKHPPTIDFYDQKDLIDLMHNSDLYVHTAVVEIEAIACLEALSAGMVPVICNSEMSATTQFALDARSLFRADDPRDLAEKIDYWIEHPEEKKEMSQKYAESGKHYQLQDSITKMEYMLTECIRDFQEREG